jgi:hypothetical protein
MIFIPCTNNLFAGTIASYGGGGANWGGAGTIIFELPKQNNQLILDDGGHAGPPTPLSSSSAMNLTLRNGAVGLAGPSSLSLGNVLISSNSSLLISNNNSLVIMTFSSATIQAGGGIIADFEGGAAGTGQGAGRFYSISPTYPCSGAGHGGNGANSAGNLAAGGSAYDYGIQPESVGSGGGTDTPYSFGGAGGGGFHLTVSGLLQNDGVISANGGNGGGIGGGGGSGGTIYLTAGVLAGAGTIAANGGAGAGSVGGGGAGGCVAIYPTSNLFSGTMTAYGGGGANRGGAGTVFIYTGEQTSQFILDNDGQYGASTPISSITQVSSLGLILRNGAVGLVPFELSLGSMLIGSNSLLLLSNSSSQLSISAASATIQAGGAIVANTFGYAAGEGTGAGGFSEISPDYPCGGAGHGGYGAKSAGNSAAGGSAYDSAVNPINLGSGGGTFSPYSVGGAGGGAFKLTVSGLLQNDGVISANGGNGSGLGGGGGAGGSIYLVAGTLSGAGSIAANGGSGAGVVGGGGAGGLIFVDPSMNQFTGTITAYGGGGANWGGAGAVYIKASEQNSQFILDNDGQYGASTPITSINSTGLILRNGAVGLTTSTLNGEGSLVIGSNAWLLVSNISSFVSMTFSSATIQAGGGIIADFNGSAAGSGGGAGHFDAVSPNYPCSGAGHGGFGANSVGNLAIGGSPYDQQTEPEAFGSGGGTDSPYSLGGAGGGAFRLTVNGTLQNDGVISANGGSGGGLGGGGGSGGSIYLTAGALSGAGSITANGGSGAGSVGGGGAGGCIAIIPTTNFFTGTISAFGGGGANWGGAGTIYIQYPSQSNQFILDNGGQSGALTPIQSASLVALILRNGATAYQQSLPQTVASLLVNSNGWLMANPVSGNSNPGIINLMVTGNATIEAGGWIVTDGEGSAASSGTGAGNYLYAGYSSYPCSGAGYGGYGGECLASSVAGGTAYGSATSPASIGSGGGGESPYSLGGAGGGSVRLTVNGTLEVDGKITANGGNASGLGGGGGSGGSIWLTVGTLTGVGSIAANGGSGAGSVGGGGGGGRISLEYAANDFVGLASAFGGGGFAQGGAGTIYTKANSQSVGQLLLDNGGAAGTNTPLSSTLGTPAQPFNLTIQNGAVVSPSPGTSFPILSNLTVASGGRLTVSSSQSILDLLVFNNVDVAPGGVIAVDGAGYSQAHGPGAGQSTDEDGSGAGYGGAGGASATAPGGASYGSSNQPVDFGSGGGLGYGDSAGGSQGGGAIRLSVGGILSVDGEMSADGEPGLQDNSGGGSGGSIWVTAGALSGGGQFTADGGAGNLYEGGGGAGGRIALYAKANVYFGLATASGAGGYVTGAGGTIYSNNVPTLQIISNSPNGIVLNAVSSMILQRCAKPKFGCHHRLVADDSQRAVVLQFFVDIHVEFSQLPRQLSAADHGRHLHD